MKRNTLRNDLLQMDPVEAIRVCLRVGVKNVKFISKCVQTGQEMSVYPFGGDPGVKAYRKQVRAIVREQRRWHSERLAMARHMKMIEGASPAA